VLERHARLEILPTRLQTGFDHQPRTRRFRRLRSGCAIVSATSSWRFQSFSELACEQSIITRSGTPAFRRRVQASSMSCGR
jgi:hypothetical protein